MDSKTLASLYDLSKELGVSKTKLMFLHRRGLLHADYVVSKKHLIFVRAKTIKTINKILHLQKQGFSLENIILKLCEKNNKRKI